MLQNELGLLPRLPSILFKCAVHPDGTPCNTSTAARAQVLGALASVMTVWLVTGILLFEAVQRIINPEPVDGKSECGGLQLPAAPGCMAASTVHWCWAGCCSQAALCGLATKCLWRMAAQLSCATPVMSKAFCVPPPCWPVMFIVAMAGVGCNILMMVRRAGQGRAAATLACRRFCRACQVAWRLCTFEGTANMKLKCPCALCAALQVILGHHHGHGGSSCSHGHAHEQGHSHSHSHGKSASPQFRRVGLAYMCGITYAPAGQAAGGGPH